MRALEGERVLTDCSDPRDTLYTYCHWRVKGLLIKANRSIYRLLRKYQVRLDVLLAPGSDPTSRLPVLM